MISTFAGLGQLPPTQLPFRDHVAAGALEMESLQASLWRRTLVQKALEDRPTDPDDTLIRAQNHAELDTVARVIPSRILWEFEK